MDINKVLDKTRSISFIVGATLLAVVGIVFLVLSDLGLKNKAVWLLVSVLLSFGSSIVCFFSETVKDKPKLVYLLKGIALALAIGFIVYLYLFFQSEICTTIKASHKFAMYVGSKRVEISRLDIKNLTQVISFVLGYAGVAIQAANIGLNAYLGIKE